MVARGFAELSETVGFITRPPDEMFATFLRLYRLDVK